MDSHVLRVRTRAQGGAPARSRLRPLAVYKPSFSLNNNNQCYHQGDDETQALLGAPRASPTRCLQQRAQPPPPVPARCRRDVAPSVDWDDKLDGQHRPLRDSPPWDGDSAESNCCCGAVALPWARAPPAPAAPPAPPPPVARAMNTHGIFSHGPEPAVAAGEPPRTLPPPPLHPRLQPPRTPSRGPAAAGPVGQGSQGSGREDAAVHRGAPLDPPWTGSGREMVSTASAAVDGGGVVVERSVPDDNEDGVVRRMLLEASAAPPRLRKELLPPLPPLASAPLRRRILVRTKPDIPSRLCSADAPLPAGHMDRFNKFRFGGRVGDKQEGAQGQGAPGGAARGNGRTRTSDKTERLRELTERLKGGSGGSEQRAAAPPSPSPSPSPSPTPGAASAPQTLAAAAAPDSPEDADLFDLRLARPESRAIVGSYIQRTIPFRSASFSQVDFSDGKYFRHSPRATWLKPLSAAATLPRKRTDELSSHPSPTPTAHLIVVEPNESHGSTPSVDSAVESAVDSAVGSDEGCCFDSPVVTAKVPGSTRSMTHPLASRQARIETRPHDGGAFLSVDGLRHLVQEGDDVLSHTLAVDTNRLTNSTSSLSDVEAPATSPSVASEDRGDQTEGNLSPSPTPTPTPLLPPPTEQGDIKPLDNPVSYEVFVRQFPNYKEYEKWMNESVLLQNGEDVGDHHEWREQIDAEFGEHPHIPEKQSKQVTADSGEPQLQHDDTKEKTEQHLADQANQTVGAVLEHDDRCINNFDPSTCPKCLEQMETGPSILQKLKASFHMEDLELEPHEKELFSRHSDLLLRKWAPPTASPSKTKHSFERSKSEPKETLKEDAKPAASAPLVLDPSVVPFHRTKSTDEPERGSGGAVSTVEPPRISLPDDMKDATSRAPPSHQDMDELRRRRPKDEPRRWLERPKLICQSSDERDDESSAGSATPSRPRFPMIGRSDSLSEGESDQGDRRPSTPSRASPSLYSHLDLSDSEGRGGSAAPTQPGGSGSRSPHTPRRYSKRPLRGPYGQMLEAEMKKPDANRKLSQYTEDLKFLEAFPTKQGSSQSLVVSSSSPPTASGSAELTRSVSSGEQRQAAAPRSRHQGAGGHSMDDSQLRATALPSPLAAAPGGAPKRKVSAVDLPFASLHPGVGGGCGAGPGSGGLPVCHQRTTSSPSQLEGIALRADMEAFRRSGVHTSPPHSLKEAAAKEDAAKRNWKDTRTHVVVELYETERSYVESLEFLVKEYMQPLKKPENAGMVDSELVEQIFYQVPAILALHQEFLDDLQKRLENWDFQQKVGDVLLNAFTKRSVIETYTAFINNWKTAKEAIKSTCQAKPAFARYLEAMAREHKGKLDIDSLLIKLVQRIPGYELLIQQLLKHTDQSHADHALLLDAQREIHELAVKINCTKMESL
ncbi:uncharacterized protein LOC113216271, partial [Frankliniella occidentalis]|uniref:Uncharacterized protein LOC113216271 n=1 Tax=Frankliniella occidentalis TaxID=133901 RepID=A0A9C6U2A6_FRAOC